MAYYPKKLYMVPQCVAGLTFYPMGLFFGYYLNLFYLNHGTKKLLSEVAIWPICAGIIAAGTTAFIQIAIKITYTKYVYEHFYFLMIGLFNIFVGGIIISSNESDVSSSLFICFTGHGICYIAALSYINIRTAKSEKRFFKISIPGFMYLLGIAVGSHSTITRFKLETDPLNEFEEVNDIVGSIITVTSSLILVCYFVNEVLHWINSYDYKISLDPDINRENSAETLFIDKYFCVTRNGETTPINCRYEAKYPINRSIRTFFFIYSNIIPVAYFYYPYIYFNKYTLDLNANYECFIIFWFGVLGCGLSLVVEYFFTNRCVYFVTIAIKLIGMCLFLLLLEILEAKSHEIICYLLFCTLGFHYQVNDVNIMSYGSIKYAEIEIFVSYMFQYLAIGIIQYTTIMEPNDLFNFDQNIVFPYSRGYFLMALLSIAIFLGAYILPKGRPISLLEIKNIINNRRPTVMITHMIPMQQATAPYLPDVYSHSNQLNFQPAIHHYPGMVNRQINSNRYIYQNNPVVLTPAVCDGRKW